MVFTIQDLVNQHIFPDLKLLAGQKGLRNEISAINSTDILDNLSSLHAKSWYSQADMSFKTIRNTQSLSASCPAVKSAVL